jgi:hypothetical protein
MTPLELDLDGPEARVPTRLVDRPRKVASLPPPVPASDGDELFSVGPYSVTSGLVRAPGAWIVEARDPHGHEVLLQLVHVRPLVNDAERALRMHVEQTVLSRTTALLQENDRVVLAHGGIDRVDGTRVLFWAMPRPEKIHRLANPLKQLKGLDHLLFVGLELAKRLVERHELGRCEPLLSEHLFLIGDESVELIGVPVQVPAEWFAADMPSPRLAPEEATHGGLTAVGDVWRLGQALSVLGCAFEPLPEAVQSLLERMVSQTVSARPPRASEVAVELEALRKQVEGTEQRSEATPTTAMTLALSQEAVNELIIRAMGDSTSVDAAALDVPVIASTTLTVFDREPADKTIAEAPMSLEEDTIIPDATIVDAPLDPLDLAETKFVSPLVYVPDYVPVQVHEESSIEEVPAFQVRIERRDPAPGRSRKRWVLGLLAGLALLGAAAFAGRPADAPAAAPDPTVTVEIAVPAGAEVAVRVTASDSSEKIVLPADSSRVVAIDNMQVKLTAVNETK